MKRLQESARLNEESGKKSPGTHTAEMPEYGGLLLENLIKSSLDKKPINLIDSFDNNNDKPVVGAAQKNSSLAALQEVTGSENKDSN